ncbi:hypothetical protein BDZ94DRAFT_1270035 [Collybia nuda]|uniref:Uncharacterized protein n=1 Tax=Collybia nuda TaxID=64659 RepID=A0A9P5XXT8_9AGAR|nr:hypothetical protein BDZ94DRAFT_1270035 [Collybia nuda]
MQCAISEYMCFSPHLPLPLDDPSDLNFGPVNLLESEDGFEIRSRKFGYEKYSPPSNTSASVQRDPGQALDVVIMGETLHDHEQAWGGFRFMGRIRPDGLISIRREPKNADDAHLGIWIFEGRLRYGIALVGQLRSSMPTEDCDTIRGIFSLHRISETW